MALLDARCCLLLVISLAHSKRNMTGCEISMLGDVCSVEPLLKKVLAIHDFTVGIHQDWFLSFDDWNMINGLVTCIRSIVHQILLLEVQVAITLSLVEILCHLCWCFHRVRVFVNYV